MLRQFVEGAERGMLATLVLVLIGSAGARAEDQGAQAANGTPAAAATTPSPAGPVTGAPGAVAATPLPPGMVPGDIVEQGPIEELTEVFGKIDPKLKGVWLLVASAEVAPGKYKNFPQLLKITEGKSGLEFHILDVRLPDAIQQSFLETRRSMALWVPSEEARKTLAADWSKLPAAKQKARDEFLFGHIRYVISTPSEYMTAFPKRSEVMEKVLEGSKLALAITEDFQPRPPRPNGSQVARRTSVYGAREIGKNEIKGDMFTAFLAMGAGSPLPLDFHGTFVMYRIASL